MPPNNMNISIYTLEFQPKHFYPTNLSAKPLLSEI